MALSHLRLACRCEGILRRSHNAAGAGLFWCIYMYCFWRMGTYLPGVPAPVQGIFKMQQVSVPLCVSSRGVASWVSVYVLPLYLRVWVPKCEHLSS